MILFGLGLFILVGLMLEVVQNAARQRRKQERMRHITDAKPWWGQR